MSQDTVKSETYAQFVDRILKPGTVKENLTHAALGIGGEAGEVVDLIKKCVIYDRELDVTKLVEEIGDVLYYMQAALNEVGLDLNHAMLMNMDKLNKRFSAGSYSSAQAIARADKA